MKSESMYITERNVNINLYPVIGSKTKKLNCEYKIPDTWFQSYPGSVWDYYCYSLMDVLSTEIRNKFLSHIYNVSGSNKYDPQNISSLILLHQPDLIYHLNNTDNDIIQEIYKTYSVEIKLSIKDILSYPQFMNVSRQVLKRTIQRVSEFKFKSQFNIKTMKVKSFDFKFTYKNSSFEPLCLINQNTDKSEYNPEYTFSFGPNIKSIISTIFVHNIFSNGSIIIHDPFSFYKLSKNANILARIKLIAYNNININLETDCVCNILGIKNSNITERRNKVRNIISELVEYKFCKVRRYDNNVFTLKV